MNAVLVVVIVGCLIAVSQAEINCYGCAGTSACKDPFNKQGVSTIKCDSCMKTKAISGTGEGTVVRGCSPTKVDSDKCDKASAQGTTAEACVCTKDMCNSGPLAIPSIALAAVLSVAVIMWKNI